MPAATKAVTRKTSSSIGEDVPQRVPASSWATAELEAIGGPNFEVTLKLRRSFGKDGSSEDLVIEQIVGARQHSEGVYTLDRWTPEMLGYFADALNALKVAQLQVGGGR